MIAESSGPEGDRASDLHLDIHSVEDPARVTTEQVVDVVKMIKPRVVVRKLIV